MVATNPGALRHWEVSSAWAKQNAPESWAYGLELETPIYG